MQIRTKNPCKTLSQTWKRKKLTLAGTHEGGKKALKKIDAEKLFSGIEDCGHFGTYAGIFLFYP